ncbi:hypothetical protein [Streptomyces sp. NPDC059850]|uniref:hypothetical protein n=1 Tax=Streptomyces sp. NPDC059850 TaxID=3346970 RepID=UPI00365E65D5
MSAIAPPPFYPRGLVVSDVVSRSEGVEPSPPYTPPTLVVLGTVTASTLGTAGGNSADDTEYWT